MSERQMTDIVGRVYARDGFDAALARAWELTGEFGGLTSPTQIVMSAIDRRA
jgi:hypothetical protein